MQTIKENINRFGIRLTHPTVKIGGRTVKNLITIPSMVSLERFMREAKPLMARKSHPKNSMDTDTSGWRGTKTINDWYEVMKRGDAKVIAKIKKSKEKANQLLGGLTPKGYTFDVEGEFFDIGEVLSNKPECWLKPIIEEENKFMTIKISTSANCSVDADEIIEGAGTLLSYISRLENDGYKVRVENILYSIKVSGDNREDLMCSIVVKDYTDFINFAKMSAIVSPALQRRGTFMLKERLLEGSLDSGYGQTISVEGITTIHDKRAMKELKNKLFKKDKK